MQNTSSLSSLPGPHWPGVVAPDSRSFFVSFVLSWCLIYPALCQTISVIVNNKKDGSGVKGYENTIFSGCQWFITIYCVRLRLKSISRYCLFFYIFFSSGLVCLKPMYEWNYEFMDCSCNPWVRQQVILSNSHARYFIWSY